MRVQPAVVAFVATLLLMPPAAPASSTEVSVLGDGVHLLCAQPVPTALECDFRLLQPAPLSDVAVSLNDIALASVDLAPRAAAEGGHAVLLLVDTSDPARQKTVERAIEHIAAVLDTATESHTFGLASFDTRLRTDAPLGSSREEVLAAAQKLRAVGRTTELYRNTLEAVRLLGAYPAQRRALLPYVW